jgi:hypothetical protein
VKKKVIAYICIVAIVFLFMYFRATIYYVINERDGFYIDIGHQPNDKIVDLAFDEDLYMISQTRAKSGGVPYHAFTRLSRDIHIEVERSLDALIQRETLPKIGELIDLFVGEDLYVLYKTGESLEVDRYVILKLSRDGDYLSSVILEGALNQELFLYQEELMVFHYVDGVFAYTLFDKDLHMKEEISLFESEDFSFQDVLLKGETLYFLMERDFQYGLYQYSLEDEVWEIGAVDPKIKDMVLGDYLYLLEYQGDYIKTLYLVEDGVEITGEIAVPSYRYYSFLAEGETLHFYGGVNVGDEIHASYGEYSGTFTSQVLDVPYNNYFLRLIKMDDSLLYVMRTNYLMDYQIRKTIYTEDDVFYRRD